MHEVFTDAWSRACCDRLNAHAPYAAAAADWEGAVVLVMTADAARGIVPERAVFLDLHHGACRGVRMADAADRAAAAYVMEADPATWEGLMTGTTDPVAAAMRGALRLTRGNVFALAKYAAAAREMVVAVGAVPARWPGGGAEGR